MHIISIICLILYRIFISNSDDKYFSKTLKFKASILQIKFHFFIKYFGDINISSRALYHDKIINSLKIM